MPKLFEIGSVVMEIEPSKVGENSENLQKSMKFCQIFNEKSPKCVQKTWKNVKIHENFVFHIFVVKHHRRHPCQYFGQGRPKNIFLRRYFWIISYFVSIFPWKSEHFIENLEKSRFSRSEKNERKKKCAPLFT